ncbi:unnamed protein product [Macrosiphum euphorbiae]|uniref:Integrator complex subunit 2 n=1 Tax=Macrosiphum euphorbiae TaxID=13131 RepID=A0AAV0XE48_9HEMI|nr:unnamed protein product [Macrosiphum euphorbiae]
MTVNLNVSPKVFQALLNVDILELCKLSAKDIRPVLPCLVRMSLISSADNMADYADGKKDVLTLLSGIELVNSIVALLSIDFHSLEIDVKKEQILRQKFGSTQADSVLIHSLQNPLSLEFERSDSTRRLRLVLSEILYISSQIQEHREKQHTVQTSINSEFYVKQSDLFDYPVYIPEVCDVLNIALSELPAILTVQDIAEVLLHVKHGPIFICWIVANFPDCFYDVCTSLIQNSERYEEENGGSRIRMEVLTQLSAMYPPAALVIRAKCVELSKMPALTIMLTLENKFYKVSYPNNVQISSNNDLVTFISGLLLGNDQQARSWFSLFIRQKRTKDSVNFAVQNMRDELLLQLQNLLKNVKDNTLPNSSVVESSVLLRLYCALKGIAGIKFQEEEITALVSLATCYPPSTPEGVRFVTISLCIMICCNTLLASSENEAKCVQWLKRLAGSESPFFGKPTDTTASFGEMLLLMAIHFHSSQLTWICDHMCNTLGMRINIRQSTMGKMKQIFTQDVFPEQVVASRSVNIPVTPNLNANMSGFLPIHCVLQLLKSQAFTKHRVNIKTWIYNQICASVSPLHPLLPSLIEAYVTSILVVPNKATQELAVNQPITEEDILKVFGDKVLDQTGNESFTAHLLLLYYLLLYEENSMSLASQPNRLQLVGLVRYKTEFLADIPIRYIVQQAEKEHPYSSLFSTLLRLLATHFPHLSLVDDWMEDTTSESQFVLQHKAKNITTEMIESGLSMMVERPERAGIVLKRLYAERPIKIWPFAPTILKFLPNTLDSNVSRYIQELYKKVWLRLNTVLPRSLWALTIKALQHNNGVSALKEENLIQDPLQVLQCDARVYRCPTVLSIVIRVLQSSLAASRSHLSRLVNQKLFATGPLTQTNNREEYKNVLTAAQDSAAVQLLLEACLETEDDQKSFSNMMTLREVRGVVCSFLHQMFIADPPLAKLVHFQGYPRELLPVTCLGIPSMHICLDFIAELLSQPDFQKQIFSIDLISNISQQYPLPKSLSLARLAINTMYTFLSVLTQEDRRELYMPTLPALVRICQVFPTLSEDCITFLNQLGRMCVSVTSVRSDIFLLPAAAQRTEEMEGPKLRMRRVPKPDIFDERTDIAVANKLFAQQVELTVKEILQNCLENNASA